MKTFIIAEVGINHNGSLDNALRLVHFAKECGANAVKFQKRSIDKVYSKEELDKPRESPWGKTNREQKLGLEFGKTEYDAIDKLAEDLNIEWFATPWDLESVEFLKQYDCKYQKVASALLTHDELLRAMAAQKKYTFISTGMSTLEEIDRAVGIFEDFQCPYELMHCNSQYPMPDNEANLLCIETLAQRYSCDVGYSGHEVGIITSVAAVALGATSIERHITLDRAMYGSDQAASMEPHGFEKMVEYIRVVETSIGDGVKKVSEAEEKIKAKLRRNKDF